MLSSAIQRDDGAIMHKSAGAPVNAQVRSCASSPRLGGDNGDATPTRFERAVMWRKYRLMHMQGSVHTHTHTHTLL